MNLNELTESGFKRFALVVLWLVASLLWTINCWGLDRHEFYKAEWDLRTDNQGYLIAMIDYAFYGRVAIGTYYDYPVSYIVPDEIYKDSFSGT